MAEREGFEPPIALRLCLISSQVHSTGLCHLSALSETNPRKLLRLFFCRWQSCWHFVLRKALHCSLIAIHTTRRITLRILCRPGTSGVVQPCEDPHRPFTVYWRRYGDCNATENRAPSPRPGGREPSARTLKDLASEWQGKNGSGFALL